MADEKSKVIAAVELAAVSNISNLTCDRIEALAGGHGMVNMAIHTVANVVADELLRGSELTIKFADVRRLPVGDIMEKAIKVAKASGADGANAALIVACIMYLAGSAAQVGIPAGNRKLGATARMLAGVDRSGVAAIPTGKMSNKVSGFAAVQAIYDAMMKGELCSYDGHKVPANLNGSPIYGHSAFGEDCVWPEMAEKGAAIGTQAMIDAMAGCAIRPHAFTAAVLGAAAILEIIHPDAEVPEGEGEYGTTTSAYLVGRSASRTAGLSEKLHMKVTGEEYDTAQLVGDVGLILKDIGAPAVIGMMAFDEIFGCFEEGIAGFSGMPFNPPLGHIGCYAVVAMKALTAEGADRAAVAKALAAERAASNFVPEIGLLCINIVARKAHELHRGPVTDLLIDASEPARAHALHRRAEYSYDQLAAGASLADIVAHFDWERVEESSQGASAIFSAMTGQDIKIVVTKIGPAARRTNKLAQKYWSFDADIDITVTVDGREFVMEGFAHKVIPGFMHGEYQEFADVIPLAGAVGADLALIDCSTLNIVIPAAVQAAMGKAAPLEAAGDAEMAAPVSRGIPGCKAAARRVAELAVNIMEYDF